MTTTVIPSGYRRMRLLKRAQYAREWWEAGAVVIVDDHTARGWLEAAHAEEAPAPPPGPQVFPTCPRCGATFPIPATLGPGDPHWVQCPSCPHGWHR
jgi:hypothetical protein